MEPLIFSNTSWHYRLARFGDEHGYRDLSDICGYTRAVIKGSLCLLVIALFVAFLAAITGDGLAWLVAGMIHGWTDAELLAGIFLAVLTVITFCLVMASLGKLYEARGKALHDSFLASSYRSVKHRFCVPVEIVGKDR